MALLEHGLVIHRLFGATDAFGRSASRPCDGGTDRSRRSLPRRDEQKNDDLANGLIFKGTPVADGDERASEIDHRRQRTEADTV